jgi:hypothetical protein
MSKSFPLYKYQTHALWFITCNTNKKQKTLLFSLHISQIFFSTTMLIPNRVLWECSFPLTAAITSSRVKSGNIANISHRDIGPNYIYRHVHMSRSTGPFKILKWVGPNAYVIDLSSHFGYHSTFNVEDLVAYKGYFNPSNDPLLLPSLGLDPDPDPVATPTPVPSITTHKDKIDVILDEQIVLTIDRKVQRFLIRWVRRSTWFRLCLDSQRNTPIAWLKFTRALSESAGSSSAWISAHPFWRSWRGHQILPSTHTCLWPSEEARSTTYLMVGDRSWILHIQTL